MVFDQALRREPSAVFVPEYDPQIQPDDGKIQALFYEGMAYHGKPSRVFAYLGVPNGAECAPVPAVVLVHGGGGLCGSRGGGFCAERSAARGRQAALAYGLSAGARAAGLRAAACSTELERTQRSAQTTPGRKKNRKKT